MSLFEEERVRQMTFLKLRKGGVIPPDLDNVSFQRVGRPRGFCSTDSMSSYMEDGGIEYSQRVETSEGVFCVTCSPGDVEAAVMDVRISSRASRGRPREAL